LERFIRSHDIRPAHLADFAGISRQHLFRVRFGAAEPTRPIMLWITDACGRLLKRSVRVSELFDLGDGER